MEVTAGWVSPAMNDQEFSKLVAIEPGIPGYMREVVAKWMTLVVDRDNGRLLTKLSLSLKIHPPATLGHFQSYFERSRDNVLVTALDWLLYNDAFAATVSNELKTILDAGRSEWTVTDLADGSPRITRRIPSGVEEFVADVVGRSGAAGGLLAEAFNAIYGAQPNPDHAYGLSVKAVETVACPKFLPTNTRATLSTVYLHLARKQVQLPLSYADVSDGTLITGMMRKLFLGAERHGSETYEHVSLEGAKAALALAASLLSLLHEDLVAVS